MLPFVAASLLVVQLGCASASSDKKTWAVGEWRFQQTFTAPSDRPDVLTGKLQIERGKLYFTGRIYFDALGKWESIGEVWVTANTIQFSRGEYNSEFDGHRVGEKMEGTWETSSGRTLAGRWKAERN